MKNISKHIKFLLFSFCCISNIFTQVIVLKNDTIQPMEELSRDQALEKMTLITTRLFDLEDTNHITFHLSKMKELIKFLDEIEDKKLIAAIHFLLENHHRSSIKDLPFWSKNIKELELATIIPMTPEIALKAPQVKWAILHKKMTVKN